jgi:hypothetical protein
MRDIELLISKPKFPIAMAPKMTTTIRQSSTWESTYWLSLQWQFWICKLHRWVSNTLIIAHVLL